MTPGEYFDSQPQDWKLDWLDALHALDDEFPAALVLPLSYRLRHKQERP